MSTQISVIPKINVRGLFAQTADSIPITGIVYESLLSTGEGTLTIPENSFKVGDTFRMTMGGHISCLNNEDLRIKLETSVGTLYVIGPFSLPQITDKHWIFEIIFTVRQIGPAGFAELLTTGQLTYSKDANNTFEGIDFSELNNTTFDTTVPQTLDILASWDMLTPGNSMYSETAVLTKIY